MGYAIDSLIVGTVLLVGMPAMTWLSYRWSQHYLKEIEGGSASNAAITGAIFALLGLMIAFTFSGAFARLDNRRDLFVQEINSIGTAYLRLDLLPEAAQPALRELFRDYVTARGAMYQNLVDAPAARQDLGQALELQEKIWSQVIAATEGKPEQQTTRLLLLPALNEMFDIVSTRTVAIQTHPPPLVWFTLTALALVCAALTGCSIGSENPPRFFFHLVFAAVATFVMLVILDVEYPRFGFVRLDGMNQLLLELRDSMTK